MAIAGKNSHILNFKTETDSDESLANLVLDLVTFRNEASHGTPDEILGSDTLRRWIAFVRAFCAALAEVITHRIIAAEVANQPESVIGIVTETFSNNIVVAICDRGSISVGETIYFLRQADCASAVIESLQLNDVVQTEIRIDRPGIEVGVRTSIRVHKNARLVSLRTSIEDEPFSAPPTGAAIKPTTGLKKLISSVFNYVKRLLT